MAPAPRTLSLIYFNYNTICGKHSTFFVTFKIAGLLNRLQGKRTHDAKGLRESNVSKMGKNNESIKISVWRFRIAEVQPHVKHNRLKSFYLGPSVSRLRTLTITLAMCAKVACLIKTLETCKAHDSLQS